MKRTLSLILVLAMVFSAMLGVISFAEVDETPATYELSANLQFAETIYLLVAVKCPADVDDTSKVTVSIKNNETDDVTTLTRDESLETGTGFPAGALAFKHTELGAKNMGDELTISVLYDGKAVEGATKIFSVLEYALKAEDVGDADLTNLVRAMIKYGAKSQTAFNHQGTYDLEDDSKNLIDYSLVRLVGNATFADGSKKAILKEGDVTTEATPTLLKTFSPMWYEYNKTTNKLDLVSSQSSATFSYKEKNQNVFATLGTPFDMTAYEGSGIITEYYDGTNYTITDANDKTVSRPTNWIYGGGTALKGDSVDTNRKFLWNLDNDYLEYTYGSKEIFFTHSQFFTPDMYKYVVANGGKFTVSITLAASDLTKGLGDFCFRSFQDKTIKLKEYKTGKEVDVTYKAPNKETLNNIPMIARDNGRLPFLLDDTKGYLTSYYHNYGGKNLTYAKIPFTTADEFVTIDIVIDLFAPCTMYYHGKAQAKCYLCDSDGKITYNSVDYRCPACYTGDTYEPTKVKRCETCNMVGTLPRLDYYINGVKINEKVICPSVSEEYFNANLTFYNFCAGTTGKLRSVVVSPFDIVNGN